jgi:hypothetical protein
MARQIGVVKERFDCFRGTSKEGVTRKYGVLGVNVYAAKPSALVAN